MRERKHKSGSLGPATELRALQLLDDGFQALDLTIAVLDNGRRVTNKMLKKSRFPGQVVEVEPHP
jgi:hypothetical protein